MGRVSAAALGAGESARKACLHCDGPGADDAPAEQFEWEVLLHSDSGEKPVARGSSAFQSTAMDEVRAVMRCASSVSTVEGRILHKIYDLGRCADPYSSREVFRVFLDSAGSVRFERVIG
ncbi:hypothetical protein GCM10009560_63190 [Nonomuraea longicatena]|uniref:Uncharacterized protein n=1 Tax=Nonomuraea longicatena TaxID=83682 RepID=A0ABP4B752_9ACTN